MLRAVDDVLDEIGAGDQPAPARAQQGRRAGCRAPRRRCGFGHPEAILVSALDGGGDGRAARAHRGGVRRDACTPVELLLPYAEGGRLAELHDVAGELEREDTAEGVRVRARVPATVAERFARFAVNGRATARRVSVARLGVQRLDPRAVLPARAHDGDAGLGPRRARGRGAGAGERARSRTGIAIELAAGPRRSGPAALRSGGEARDRARQRPRPHRRRAIAASCRSCCSTPTARPAFTVEPGERIAQLVVVVAIAAPDVVEVTALAASARGEDGFGSTG